MTTNKLVDSSDKLGNNPLIYNNEKEALETTNLNKKAKQLDVLTSIPSLSLTDQSNKKEIGISNTEIVNTKGFDNKDNSKLNETNLIVTADKLLIATKLVNTSDKAHNNSSIYNNKKEGLEATNLNEKVEQIDRSTSTLSVSSTTISNKEEANISNKELKHKDDSKVNNTILKSIVEKSLTENRIVDSNNQTTGTPTIIDKETIESPEKVDLLNETVQKTEATVSSYNKDLSTVKDNIRLFSNSLNDDDEDIGNEPIEHKTFKKPQKVQEVVVLGKIEKNVPLKTGTVNVSAMMIKGNGNYIETGRAKKTHAIRINFKMHKNENVSPGNKEVFIVIQNPKGKVINERGMFTLRSGKEIFYSDETMAYYDGYDINISILSGRFVQKIIEGTYIVKIYIERYLTGQTFLILS